MSSDSLNITDRQIVIKNITDAICQMPDHKGFLTIDENRSVKPAYTGEIKSLFLLMHWPLFSFPGNNGKLNFVDTSKDNSEDITSHGLSIYAAVMEHGKSHIAEVFFANEENGEFMGSHMVFSLELPNNEYTEDYDPWLMEELANKVLGVHREKTLGNNLQF